MEITREVLQHYQINRFSTESKHLRLFSAYSRRNRWFQRQGQIQLNAGPIELAPFYSFIEITKGHLLKLQ